MIKELKRIHNLAIPIYLSFLVGVVFSLADNIIIGQYNVIDYAIVTIIGSLIYYVTGSIGAYSIALTLKGSPLIQKAKFEEYSSLFSTALALGIIISIGFVLLTITLGKPFLSEVLLIDKNRLEKAFYFLCIISLTVPLNIFIFSFSSYFRTIEKAKILTFSSICSSTINIVVNLILVFGLFGLPKLGAIGIAIGSVSGLMVGLIMFIATFFYDGRVKLKITFDRTQSKELMRLFTNLFFQDLFEFTIFFFVVYSVISSLGTTEAAIFGVLNISFSAFLMSSHAYGSALTVLVKKAECNLGLINRYWGICIVSLLALWITYTLAISVSGSIVPNIITSDTVVTNGFIQILWFFGIYQLIAGCSNIFRATINGLGHENFALRACIAVFTTCSLILYIAKNSNDFTLHGILVYLVFSYSSFGTVLIIKMISISSQKNTLAI